MAWTEFPFPLTHFIFDQQDLKSYMEEQQKYPLLTPDKHNWYPIKTDYFNKGKLSLFLQILFLDIRTPDENKYLSAKVKVNSSLFDKLRKLM